MEPKYSILLCNKNLSEYENRINEWLSAGIKVLWFGKSEEEIYLKDRYTEFARAFMLQMFTVNITDQGIIVDGDADKELFEKLAECCPAFNSAQYIVEHCKADENIVVQASAGTGKTTVMIDRIMYLLHTCPDLKLSEIFMITFTNEAAGQMSTRLQDVLMTRYTLTGQKKYIRWLEEQSQMMISTIHSFAFFMLKQFGTGEGFTKGLSIRTLEKEKKDLIKDSVDKKVNENRNIKTQLGVPFYRAISIVNDYWNKIRQQGISYSELVQMDWGESVDEDSVHFHETVKQLIQQLDEQYFDIERNLEAVSVDDIMRVLQEVLISDELPKSDISIKYLFIDEFQDTDLSQIRSACLISKIFGSFLFVVGDVKQSIYRFRGATDKAFRIFDIFIREMGLKQPAEFELRNNYRTASEVLERLDEYFFRWSRRGLLKFDEPVIPFNKDNGKLRMIPSAGRRTEPEQIADIVRSELDSLIYKIEFSGIKPTQKNRVVLLTRSNRELNELSDVLKTAKIPASVRRDGAFYTSEAVRDFYMLVLSYLFCDEPKYIFNYLMTPYSGNIEPMDINQMESLNGNKEKLIGYLDRFLDQTIWKDYKRQLRLRPVIAVFNDIINEVTVIENYISLKKARLLAKGWEESRAIAETAAAARQYKANLEKLIETLRADFSGDKVSIYDIYNFLKYNIASNRSEEEAPIESAEDYTSVLCMTVHKSKGLEFDTVIIPYTNENFGGRPHTELVVDPIERKVGWYYSGDIDRKDRKYKYSQMKNSYYDEIQADEARNARSEGVRILYVGMTRAIETLICIVEESRNPLSWASLIEEVGVDYE